MYTAKRCTKRCIPGDDVVVLAGVGADLLWAGEEDEGRRRHQNRGV
jgi:hypothetical protein